MRFPPPLEPGGVVVAVAPSSPFSPVLAWRGLGWLSERYRVRFDRGIFENAGYLAGDDERRRLELERALFEPGVGAIIGVRGGYGASRFVHMIDWARFSREPRWVVGFSDLTAIHVELSRAGVASIHGAHVTGVGRGDARARADLVRALEAPADERAWSGLTPIVGGDAEGVLFGGNLTLLHACAAAGRLWIPEGAVLFLEDVSERPYRLDRMLATLEVGGHLARVSGVVLGGFTECGAGPDGIDADAAVRDRVVRLGVPVAGGLPSGHGLRNDALILGSLARLSVSSVEGILVTSGPAVY